MIAPDLSRPSSSHRPVLVLGATGKTGSRVAARLRAAGVPARAGSRQADPPFDWSDPTTWDAALRGVGAVYVTYQPDLAVAGACDTVRAFTERAVAAGVERLVLLTGRGQAAAEAAERALHAIAARGGASWTVIRASWFAQNFSESFLHPMVMAGVIALPAGAVREPFVDVDDIADVAVAALTQPGHASRTYDVTGSELLDFAEAAHVLGAALGRDVAYVDLPPATFRTGLHDAGVPAELAALLVMLFEELLDGRNAYVGAGVREALGREPRAFSDWVREAAAMGTWSERPGTIDS